MAGEWLEMAGEMAGEMKRYEKGRWRNYPQRKKNHAAAYTPHPTPLIIGGAFLGGGVRVAPTWGPSS